MNLKCIINGETTEVEAQPTDMVWVVRLRALHTSGNLGRPPTDFDIRDAAGNRIFPTWIVGDLGLIEGSILWLSPHIGCGGSNKFNHRRIGQRFRVEHDPCNHTHWWEAQCKRRARLSVRRSIRHTLKRATPPVDDSDADARFVTLKLRNRVFNPESNRFCRLGRESWFRFLKDLDGARAAGHSRSTRPPRQRKIQPTPTGDFKEPRIRRLPASASRCQRRRGFPSWT